MISIIADYREIPSGLPRTGPVLASRLYGHFGSIKSVVTASAEELQTIKGIGKKSTKVIVDFVSGNG